VETREPLRLREPNATSDIRLLESLSNTSSKCHLVPTQEIAMLLIIAIFIVRRHGQFMARLTLLTACCVRATSGSSKKMALLLCYTTALSKRRHLCKFCFTLFEVALFGSQWSVSFIRSKMTPLTVEFATPFKVASAAKSYYFNDLSP
jgi:hypothetical protein